MKTRKEIVRVEDWKSVSFAGSVWYEFDSEKRHYVWSNNKVTVVSTKSGTNRLATAVLGSALDINKATDLVNEYSD
jgi:hypothetical protein